jgi:hypothetical protein
MFHLASKVYITSDKLIDLNVDRVVISATDGFPIHSELDGILSGKLIAYSTSISELFSTRWLDLLAMVKSLITHSESTGLPVMIYADSESFMHIMVAWYKIILKNTTQTDIENLIKFNVFRYKTFYRSAYSSNSGLDTNETLFNISNLSDYYLAVDIPDQSDITEFMNAHRNKMSVEHLLASYLADGSCKEELKTTLKPLIKKDLEKYLHELKEIFWTHIMTDRFLSRINIQKKSVITLPDILGSTNKFVQLFTSVAYWKSPFMTSDSSTKNNVKFDNFTDEIIDDFKEFANLAGQTWTEEKVYEMIKSDIGKLDFLPCITSDTFTDEMLDSIINTESTFHHAAGSFFAIDFETINNWLITELLQKRTNSTFIRKYTLK